MSNQLLPEDKALLKKIYYEDGVIVGRDRLFQYVRSNYADRKITRRAIADWIKAQEITQLHAKHEAPKNIKSTVAKAPHSQLGIDLIDMQLFEGPGGYKYILTASDLFSRKLYAQALKNEEDATVLAGFKRIYSQIPDVKSIRSDRGSEFIADIFKDYLKQKGIKQILSSAHAPQSNGAIERANQSLKRLIHKNLAIKKEFNWVKELPKIVGILNSLEVDGKGATANEIEDGDDEMRAEIRQKDIAKKENSMVKTPHPKGAVVRTYDPTHKMHSRVWSKEVYKIQQVFKPKTPYGIYEYKLEGLDKKFKHEDLQAIKKVQNVQNEAKQFEVSKLLDKKKIDGSVHYLVKWKGYRKASDNTWESRAKLMEDVPKMVNAFDKSK